MNTKIIIICTLTISCRNTPIGVKLNTRALPAHAYRRTAVSIIVYDLVYTLGVLDYRNESTGKLCVFGLLKLQGLQP